MTHLKKWQWTCVVILCSHVVGRYCLYPLVDHFFVFPTPLDQPLVHVCRWLCVVPTRTGKLGKMGNYFQSEKKIWTDLKVREFYPEYWKSQGILASFLPGFLIEVYLLNRLLYLLNLWNKTLKILENGKKYWKVRKICQSESVGTHVMIYD